MSQEDKVGTISINNLPRLCKTNLNWSNQRKQFPIEKKKKKKRRHSAESIMDAVNADDLALPVNTSTRAESLLPKSGVVNKEHSSLRERNQNRINGL